jgi:hypothetical protein
MHNTSFFVPVLISGMLALRMMLSVIWEGTEFAKASADRR